MPVIDLKNYRIEKFKNSRGKLVIFDRIRKKELLYTPEEEIRQKMICYLIEELKVPEYMIDVETSLRYYHFESKRRPDILVLKKDESIGDAVPMVVIECKQKGTIIDEKIIKQTIYYAENLNCDYAVITDGTYIDIIHYNKEAQDIDELTSLPIYEKMIRQ